MAHDPKVKADLLSDWATGEFTNEQLAEKYSVGKGTVDRWIKEKAGQNGPAPKLNRYMEALEEFGVATMKMLTAQAELYSDHSYLIKQSADDQIKQRESLLTGLERFIRLHRPLPSAGGYGALPQREEPTEPIVIPELVEEDSPS